MHILYLKQNAIKYKNLANKLIDLYGDDEEHKQNKIQLVNATLTAG